MRYGGSLPEPKGRSKFLSEEVVGVANAVESWAGKGEVLPKAEAEAADAYDGIGGSHLPNQFWSEKFQWLPANLAFQSDGTVKFTSYINNLHPTKYADIYHTIEKLIDTAIPAWDHCLTESESLNKTVVGRKDKRVNAPDPCECVDT